MADPNSGEQSKPSTSEALGGAPAYPNQLSMESGNAGQVSLATEIVATQPRNGSLKLGKPTLLERLKGINPFRRRSSNVTSNRMPDANTPDDPSKRRFLKGAGAAVGMAVLGGAAYEAAKPGSVQAALQPAGDLVNETIQGAIDRQSSIGVPPGEFMGDKNPRKQVEERDQRAQKPDPIPADSKRDLSTHDFPPNPNPEIQATADAWVNDPSHMSGLEKEASNSSSQSAIQKNPLSPNGEWSPEFLEAKATANAASTMTAAPEKVEDALPFIPKTQDSPKH